MRVHEDATRASGLFSRARAEQVLLRSESRLLPRSASVSSSAVKLDIKAAALDAGPLVPVGVFMTAIWTLWAALGGGDEIGRWASLGVLVVLCFGIAAAVIPIGWRELGRARIVMLGALFALVALSFLSILWADARGDAWVGSARLLVYAVIFAMFALRKWRSQELILLLVLFTVGIAVIAVISLLRAAGGHASDQILDGGRFILPFGYANGSVALWMLALWPAVGLGSAWARHPASRALFIGSATLFVNLAVLGQSRAWLILLPAAIVVFLLLVRHRLRVSVGLVLVACTVAPFLRPLLNVYTQSQAGVPVDPALHRAALFAFLSAAIAATAGALWAFAEPRLEVSERLRAAAPRAGIALLVCAAVAAVVLIAIHPQGTGEWVSHRWKELTYGNPPDSGGARLTSGIRNDNRYDLWKVAWHEFENHPLLGIGADNFAIPYLQHRADAIHYPRYPHSTPLQILSQYGVIGAILFAITIGIAVALALRRRRQSGNSMTADAPGICLMVFAYWLLHGSVDVLWEYAALAGPALGLLAAAGSPDAAENLVPGTVLTEEQPTRRPVLLTRRAGPLLLLIPACAVLILPWLSDSVTNAGAALAFEPSRAYDRLELAADLNPLSPNPDDVEGIVAMRSGDLSRARTAFKTALRREPKDWYATFELGLLAGQTGDYAVAGRYFDQALTLNPREPAIQVARELAANRATIRLSELNGFFVSPAGPPPEAFFFTGFEYGPSAVLRRLLFDQVVVAPNGAIEVVTGDANRGTRSLQVTVGSGATYVLKYVAKSNFSHIIARFYVELAGLPRNDSVIAALSEESPAYALFRVRPDGVLEASAKDESGAVRAWVQGPRLKVGRWYRIDANYDTSTSTYTLEWMVDGRQQPPARYTGSGPVATWPGIMLGAFDGSLSPGLTARFDDVAVSTDPADYPFGAAR